MMPSSATYLAAGIDQINEQKWTLKTAKRITLGRTMFMDAPFFYGQETESYKRERKSPIFGLQIFYTE